MTNPLRVYSHNVKSSDGEDGIIQKIFEVVEPRNRWCVELGALNGTHDSNSWNLINNQSWSAVLIEADPTYFEKVAALYQQTPTAHTVQAFISFEGTYTLDAVLSCTPIPHDFDLLILDIDGNDYHVWDSLQKYHPRVVCVEFNPTIPNDISFVQPRDMNVQQGSSLKAIADLARQKGYCLIATVDANAFFVVSEEFAKLSLPDDSLDFLHPTSPFYTRVYQLYDGTLVLDGYKRLFWHNIPINEEQLQTLPRHKRRYHARIASAQTIRHLKYYLRKVPLYSIVQRYKKWLVR